MENRAIETQKQDIAYASKSYWMHKTLDQLSKCKIQYDFINKNEFEKGHSRFILDQALAQKIIGVSKNENIMIFTVLSAAIQVCLYKYTSESKISIGIPGYSKSSDRVAKNKVLPLISDLNEDMNFKELVRNTQKGIVECYKNQYFSLDSILKLLKVDDSAMQLSAINISLKGFHSDEYIDEITDSTDNEISFCIERQLNNEIAINIIYNTLLFKETTIKKLYNHYINIMGDALNHSDKKLKDLEIMTQADKNKLLYEFNDTYKPYPKEKTIHQLFEEQVEKTPQNIALTYNEQNITYKILNDKANQLARLLIERGAKSNDNIALIVDRSFEMIIGMLAILKCGGAYVPIDPEYPEDRIKYILENSNVSAVLVDKDYGLLYKNIIQIDFDEICRFSNENLCIHKDSKDLAYIIYTSGSTGAPKGVMIEHHSAINLIGWVNKEFSVSERDNLLFITSMCFDLSVYDIFGILAAGGRVVIVTKEHVQNPEELKEIIVKERITFWDSVPTTIQYLVNALGESWSHYIQEDVRVVFMSGDWIPVALPDKIKRFFPNARVISLGGATEGTVWSIFYPIEETMQNQKSIPYGKPMDNNYFYILDKDQNPVPECIIGELYIGGVGVARGYINDNERTKISFIKNKFLNDEHEMMYKTGDIGRMMPDGNIEFIGRLDNQVKIRGYRIELGEIESKLQKQEYIKEAIVLAKSDENNIKYLCGYIVSDQKIVVSELKEHLLCELPEYMIPQYFIQLDNMPVTSNGKIDRKSLLTIDINNSIIDEYEPPRNEMEARLIRIWQDVLGVDKVGIANNFFEMGGHSLKATILKSKIESEFGVMIPLTDYFTHSTIKAFYDNLLSDDKHQSKFNNQNLVLIKKGGEKNLFFVHAALGTVNAYIELCNNLDSRFNCWGIQADRIDNYSPKNITIEGLAAKYINSMKEVQLEGPYNIVGWSMGGAIAYEMVRQLEEKNESIGIFIMLDTNLAHRSTDINKYLFNIETERVFIERVFVNELQIKDIEDFTDITQGWLSIRNKLHELNINAIDLLKALGPNLLKIIGYNENMDIDELINSINMARSLGKASIHYTPANSIKTQIHFFRATESEIAIREQQDENKNIVYNLEGDHYTIMEKPYVLSLSSVLGEIIK